LVIGLMIIPYVSSLSEDALRAVPMNLREAAFSLGSGRLRTALWVVLPAAVSGVTASAVLALSRALGETMVVAIAAGQQAQLVFDPREGAATLTSYIAQVAMGDVPRHSVAYQSLFAVGLSLFLLTLVFNVAGHWVRNRFREAH
jgi:phosphate transport system permease protein